MSIVSALTTVLPLAADASMASGVNRLRAPGKPRHEVGRDALRCAPVPELRHAPAFAAAGKDFGDTSPDEHPIPPHDYIGPLLHRDRALGVLAHGQARHAERRGFFLD